MSNLRKHILINPAFQLRFACLFTIAVLVFSAIFPVFAYSILGAIQSHVYFANNPTATEALRQARSDLTIFLILTYILTIVTSFSLALFHSHRIAGPLYKLRISMVAMQQGVLDKHIRFREKDNFEELADGFNAMTDAIFIRRRRDFERVNSVLPKLERLQASLAGEDQSTITEVVNALKELSNELPLK